MDKRIIQRPTATTNATAINVTEGRVDNNNTEEQMSSALTVSSVAASCTYDSQNVVLG